LIRRVEFAPAARAELDAAAAHYELEYPGRGPRFYAAVARAVRSAASTPSAGPPFPGIPELLAVRRRIVRGFPFVLAYRDLGDLVRIDAVAHQRRRPGYWLVRLP
jgi:plasmid stabilization system protein ParE